MGLEAAWCASSPAPRVHGKSASDGSGCAGALVQCRGMRLLIRESQRPRPQRRITGRPRGTLSRAGALAHRLARARRSATLSASIHGLRSCGVRSRCRSTSRRAVVPRSDEIGNRSPGAGIVTPRQSNPLCRCAPSAGEVNIILVVTSTLRVRNKVVDVGVSLTRRPYTARRLYRPADHRPSIRLELLGVRGPLRRLHRLALLDRVRGATRLCESHRREQGDQHRQRLQWSSSKPRPERGCHVAGPRATKTSRAMAATLKTFLT
jgi:hypothetical protein